MMDRLLSSAVVLLAALGSGVVCGIFYAFSSFVMAALARLPVPQGVAAMNAINQTVITPSFMLVFLGTSVLCVGVVVSSSTWWPHTSGKLAVIGALLYLAGGLGLTLVGNQPMNLALAALPADQAARYWSEYLPQWVALNHARTAATFASTVLFVAALALR